MELGDMPIKINDREAMVWLLQESRHPNHQIYVDVRHDDFYDDDWLVVAIRTENYPGLHIETQNGSEDELIEELQEEYFGTWEVRENCLEDLPTEDGRILHPTHNEED